MGPLIVAVSSMEDRSIFVHVEIVHRLRAEIRGSNLVQ